MQDKDRKERVYQNVEHVKLKCATAIIKSNVIDLNNNVMCCTLAGRSKKRARKSDTKTKKKNCVVIKCKTGSQVEN